MVEHRIIFPRNEKTAHAIEEWSIDERSSFEFEALGFLQKMEFLRHLTRRAPQFRSWNREPGRVIPATEIPKFLPVVAELRKKTPDLEFGRLLDRVYDKAVRSRDLGLPIFLFR